MQAAIRELLCKLGEVTNNPSLQQQMLVAAFTYMRTAMPQVDRRVRPTNMGLCRLMADLLVCFWDQPFGAESVLAAYVTIGMPNQSHTAVQNLLLSSLHSAAATAEEWRYIGQHALPLLVPTWVQFGKSGMRECIGGVDVGADLPEIEAFVTILARYGQTRPCADPSPYPESAALATFQMLYHIVWKLVLEQQKSERAGRTALQSQLMGGDAAGPGFLALGREVDDDASQRLLELTKSLGLLQAQVEMSVPKVQRMWADPGWCVVMLPALKSFTQDTKIKASLKTWLNLLRAKRIMPEQSLDAVLGCFTAPQVATNSGHGFDTAAHSNGQSAHASSSSSAATSSDEDFDYKYGMDEDMTDEDVTDEDVADAEWGAPESAGAVDFEELMRNFVRRTALATNDMEGGEEVE
ncbi:TPA: hypothetical protein ACH3X3_002154 [Trebouxia sp. C0006]